MATPQNGSNARSKRLTAEKVRQMFANMDESDDLESGGSEYNVGNDDDDSATSRPSTSSASSDRSRQGAAQPEPGPSGERPAKRARTNDVDGWKEVKTGLDLETGNNFRFLPKNGREPGISPDLDLDLDPVNSPSPLRCLKALLTDALFDYIIQSINDFAAVQVTKNTPARRRTLDLFYETLHKNSQNWSIFYL